MKNHSQLSWVLGSLMLLFMAPLYAAHQGQNHPSTLMDFEGTPHTLSDYKNSGQWLVVMLWASDCHVCNQEAHSYDQFHKKHKNLDAAVLGISMDGLAGKANAADFIERHQVTFPNLIGDFEDIAQMFVELTGEQWIGTPTFLFYSPTGELVAQQVGGVPVEMIENFMQANS